MNLRYIIVSALALMIVGCGSSPKEESETSDSTESTGAFTKAAPETREVEPPAPVSAKAQSEARSLLSGVSDAIKSGNDEAVMRAASQVLTQNPNEPKALNAMGVYHYKKGRFLAANYFFSKALKVKADSDVLNNLALVKLAQGERREAIATFKKALFENANNGLAAANLGSIYIQEKDYTKASVVLETAVKRGIKDPKTLINYGIAQSALGSHDSAKDLYQEALKLAPNSQEATLNLAILYIEHLNLRQDGLRQLDRLRFLGPDETIRKRMIELEKKAKSDIK